ncbi:CAP domain-containing protein [Caldicellulosiruptoraceae bacterium PP1]
MKKLFAIFLMLFLTINYTSFASITTKENNSKKSAYIYEKQDTFIKDFKNTYMVLPSLFFGDFYVYENPSDFYIASFSNKKLVFLYTTSKNFVGVKNVTVGSKASLIKNIFKNKIINKYIIDKNYITYTFSDSNLGKDYDCIDMNFYYIFVFYDLLKNPSYVNGILIVDKTLWNSYLINDKYINDFEKVQESFAKINFYHLNSLRASLKLKPLMYSEKLASVALNHSINMSKLNFFSHTDLDGLSPFDRMTNAGIKFMSAGENIAYGNKMLPIFANHLLFNSPGHRHNIEGNFDYIGVGVRIRSNDLDIYYTQNFIR